MKLFSLLFSLSLLLSPVWGQSPRVTEDFNFGWKFTREAVSEAWQIKYDDAKWEDVRLPHDWSIRASYQKENTAASTGFVEGGIGWYRKEFSLPETDKDKHIRIEFDGVFCNSEVWINGKPLGIRPNGYSSFSYDLSSQLNFGKESNIVVVKADHSAYADTRWYTGSGIYRNVRLIKTSAVHIPHWGVQISTPQVDTKKASILIQTQVEGANTTTSILVNIVDADGKKIAEQAAPQATGSVYESTIQLKKPNLWGISSPYLYKAIVVVKQDNEVVDEVETTFGIRSFNFDAQKGFSLNGTALKIKGVNLHHDAGAMGAAATKASWEYRVRKLKSIGVNAIRMSHNPHSVELMEVCDEMGMLVMDEFFDEWHKPKGKNVVYIGDNAAKGDISKGYSAVFHDWAERDLKDLIRRDFNHPSVILWSIGNEIEWTFPFYSETFSQVNGDINGYNVAPSYDMEAIQKVHAETSGGLDSLVIVAHQLASWVKEMDTTRPVVCGSVLPSVALASGYADAVDILGLNYRAADYDALHKAFPDQKIIGSENWVSYGEWKSCAERDFVSGIFVWTGFAYLGEAGPWPRKGLNISLFDFAGNKTPRGHFFECLWKEDPKVYMVTTPAEESEFSYTEDEGWKFEMQLTPPPVWNMLRKWEWYKVNEKWNYPEKQDVVIQAYTNCEEAELFLNDESLGKKQRAAFAVDNIIKWLVPFQQGELKLIGYEKGKKVDEYILNSTGELAKIVLYTDKQSLQADAYDLAHVKVKLFDKKGREIKDLDTPISFELSGSAAHLLAVDNGWEMNVDNHYGQTVKTHNGTAIALIQAGMESGEVLIHARVGEIESEGLRIVVK